MKRRGSQPLLAHPLLVLQPTLYDQKSESAACLVNMASSGLTKIFLHRKIFFEHFYSFLMVIDLAVCLSLSNTVS